MIFSLTKEIIFPPAELAEENGILAVGGDLSPKRLIAAYSQGIFPWFSGESPIIWWSPDPRFVIFPDEIKISRSMRQVIRRGAFRITLDQRCREVIGRCRNPRKDQDSTWITDEMMEAYIRLHEMGLAHSVEAWQGGTLAGGLYGISLGKSFFGESMFAAASNASKAAFIYLAERLERLDFRFIDCQVHTDHLESLGACYITRRNFLELLKEALEHETLVGDWGGRGEFSDN
jgi:leucyl/phenylalanyl-tRNA--protein transferase